MKVNFLNINLLFLFIIIFSAILFFNINTLNKQINHELEQKIDNVKININSSLYYFNQATQNINHFIINNNTILNILSKANNATASEQLTLRHKLQTILGKPYKRMKNMGILQLQFALSDNRSFLRMYYPNKFGDDLSKIRETYKEVKKTKKPVFAFENGKYLQGYRHVYPLFDKNKNYIGAFELSYDSIQLQRNLNNISKITNHFLIKKDILKVRFEDKKPLNNFIKSIENDNYIFSPNTEIENHQKIIKEHKKTIADKMDNEEEFTLYTNLKNNTKTITFLPLKNLKGKVNAYLVVYDNNTYIHQLIEKSYIINILIFISLCGLFIFVSFLKNQKILLDKLVTQKTEKLNESIKVINEFVLYSKTDTKGKIVDVSDAFCELTEYTKEELLGKNHRMLRPKEYKQDKIYKQMWSSLLKNESWHGEIQDVSKSGKKFWLETKINPVKNHKGQVIEYVAYRYNISDKKQLIDINNNLENIILEETSKSLKQKEIILKQEKMVALGNMMDAIAHQWKQPLSIISMSMNNFLMDYILNSKVTQKNIDNLENEIKTQIEHLVATIDEFRNFFRPNQKFTKIKLYDIIDNTIKLMHGTIVNSNINISLNIDKELEIECITNEFKHIIINLINNAKDAFIENELTNRQITFETSIKDEYIILNVYDNAGGIPKDIIKNIFIPNFTTKHEQQGTGIGLYMVKQIVEKLNGTIEVSTKKDGTCFSLKLLKCH